MYLILCLWWKDGCAVLFNSDEGLGWMVGLVCHGGSLFLLDLIFLNVLVILGFVYMAS